MAYNKCKKGKKLLTKSVPKIKLLEKKSFCHVDVEELPF